MEERHEILSLNIADKSALASSYMPFIQHGAIFVPTDLVHEMGDKVPMILNLIELGEKLYITGTVVWITPRGAQGRHQQGIGVQLDEQQDDIRDKIEAYLKGCQTKQTYTM